MSIFNDSLRKPRSLQLRNVPFWSMGVFKGLGHLEFINGAQTMPSFIPLILGVLQTSPLLKRLFIGTCCLLSHPRYVCAIVTLPNLRRLRVTSDAISKIFRLIDMPSSVNIEIARSFYDVSEPGVNVPSCLHADLLWINFWIKHGMLLFSSTPMPCPSRRGTFMVELSPST